MTYKELISKAMSEPNLNIFVFGDRSNFLENIHAQIIERLESYGITASFTRGVIRFRSGTTIRFVLDDGNKEHYRGYSNPIIVSGYGLDAEERAKAEAAG